MGGSRPANEASKQGSELAALSLTFRTSMGQQDSHPWPENGVGWQVPHPSPSRRAPDAQLRRWVLPFSILGDPNPSSASFRDQSMFADPQFRHMFNLKSQMITTPRLTRFGQSSRFKTRWCGTRGRAGKLLTEVSLVQGGKGRQFRNHKPRQGRGGVPCEWSWRHPLFARLSRFKIVDGVS